LLGGGGGAAGGAEAERGQVALELVLAMGYFAPQPVPLALLAATHREGDAAAAAAVRKALIRLHALSLVRFERGGAGTETASMHRLVMAYMRHRSGGSGAAAARACHGAQRAVAVVDATLQRGQGAGGVKMQQRTYAHALFAHAEEAAVHACNVGGGDGGASAEVEALPLLAAELLCAVGECAVYRLGAAAAGRSAYERALPIQEALHGADHVLVARTLIGLGSAYGDLRDAGKMKALLERALPIMEAHYGAGDVQVANTLVYLGNAYGKLGSAEQQKALLERALVIQEVHYGADDAEVARTLTNLGNAYGDLGCAEKKKALLQRALRIKEVHYGADHVQVATTKYGLAVVTGSAQLAGETHAVFLANYGPEHPHTQLALLLLLELA
jgi:tetratricopeptide (TPR) repeat protein